MKKFLLLSLGVAVAVSSFAKLAKNKTNTLHPAKTTAHATPALSLKLKSAAATAAKTTGDPVTDTIELSNDPNIINDLNTYVVDQAANLDSGYLYGPNAIGWSGFAERYDVAPAQPGFSIAIVGVLSLWSGVTNSTSTHSIACNIWSVDSSITPDFGNYFISAVPGSVLTSATIPVTGLGIDNPTVTYFTTPMNNFAGSFYAGYVPSFDFADANGDTIGLYSSSIDSGYVTGEAAIVNSDTVLYARSVTQINNVWNDNYWDLGLNTNYVIIPLLALTDSTGTIDTTGSDTTGTTSVASVTKNNLTVFSNYPNPSVNSTNLKFALNNTADVTVQIMDAAGRIMNTIKETKLSTGTHTINVSTASMPSGNYICLFRTSDGSAIASQLTVLKQ